MTILFNKTSEEVFEEVLNLFKKEHNIQYLNQNLLEYIKLLSNSFFSFSTHIQYLIEQKFSFEYNSETYKLSINSILKTTKNDLFLIDYLYSNEKIDTIFTIKIHDPRKHDPEQKRFDYRIDFFEKQKNNFIETGLLKFNSEEKKEFLPLIKEFIAVFQSYVSDFLQSLYDERIYTLRKTLNELEKIKFIFYQLIPSISMHEIIQKNTYYELNDIYDLLISNEDMIYLKTDVKISSYLENN